MSSNEKTHRCGRRRLWKIPFIIAAIVLVKSGLVLLLWNYLIPDLFSGPTLAYPQAIGLVVLAKLLVGFHGGPRHFGRGQWGRHGHHCKDERWSALSPEEREKLRDDLKDKWNK